MTILSSAAVSRVHALRARGFSDRSIAKHLGLPIVEIRKLLGIQSYVAGGQQKSAEVVG